MNAIPPISASLLKSCWPCLRPARHQLTPTPQGLGFSPLPWSFWFVVLSHLALIYSGKIIRISLLQRMEWKCKQCFPAGGCFITLTGAFEFAWVADRLGYLCVSRTWKPRLRLQLGLRLGTRLKLSGEGDTGFGFWETTEDVAGSGPGAQNGAVAPGIFAHLANQSSYSTGAQPSTASMNCHHKKTAAQQFCLHPTSLLGPKSDPRSSVVWGLLQEINQRVADSVCRFHPAWFFLPCKLPQKYAV